MIEMKHVDLFSDYCNSTSLHGWFFYGGSKSEKKLSWAGCFWLLVLLASMSAAVFVMGTTIHGKMLRLHLLLTRPNNQLRLVQTCVNRMHLRSKIENFLTGCVFRVRKKQHRLMRFTQYV